MDEIFILELSSTPRTPLSVDLSIFPILFRLQGVRTSRNFLEVFFYCPPERDRKRYIVPKEVGLKTSRAIFLPIKPENAFHLASTHHFIIDRRSKWRQM
jgi:hypothetical protein